MPSKLTFHLLTVKLTMMKKSILLIGISVLTTFASHSQIDCQQKIDSLKQRIKYLENNFSGANSTKRVQAGLTTNLGMNFLIPGKTKLINSNGLGSCFSIGMALNSGFKSSPNLGIATGIEFDFETNKYITNFNDAISTNDVYYDYNEATILSQIDSSQASASYKLQDRNQKSIYATVPVMMIFRTDFIGDFRYFGKFGIRNSFLIKNTINDTGVELPSVIGSENKGFVAKGDQFFYKGSVGISAGAEWKFINSTTLVLEAGYFYGITPLHLERKEEKQTLYTVDNGVRSYFSNKANQNQLLFKISILF